MYVWIWRRLPGNRGWKAVQALVLIATVCALLLLIVFPWVEPHLPISSVTVSPSR